MRGLLLAFICILLMQGCHRFRMHHYRASYVDPADQTRQEGVGPYQVDIPGNYSVTWRHNGLIVGSPAFSRAKMGIEITRGYEGAAEGEEFPAGPRMHGYNEFSTTAVARKNLHGIRFERVGWRARGLMRGFEYRALDGTTRIDIAAESADAQTLDDFDKIAGSFRKSH